MDNLEATTTAISQPTLAAQDAAEFQNALAMDEILTGTIDVATGFPDFGPPFDYYSGSLTLPFTYLTRTVPPIVLVFATLEATMSEPERTISLPYEEYDYDSLNNVYTPVRNFVVSISLTGVTIDGWNLLGEENYEITAYVLRNKNDRR